MLGDFEWAPKRTILPKQIVATKMRLFCTFRTQIVLAYFSKNAIKKNLHNHKKKHYFSGFFLKVSFSGFFRLFYFGLSNIIKTNTKNANFFGYPFSDTLTNSQKIFSHPYTLFVCFKTPKDHSKIGENKQQKILDRFQLNLGQIFSSRNAKS